MLCLIGVLVLVAQAPVVAQSSQRPTTAEGYFHNAAGTFVQGNLDRTRQTLREALSQYPNNKKLRQLEELLKEKEQEQQQQDQQQNQEQQQNQDQQQQNQEQQQQQQQQQEQQQNQDQQNQQQQQDQQEQQQQQQEGQQGQPEQQDPSKADEQQQRKPGEMSQETKDRLEKMKISQEMAARILEAMRNKEAQYLQQLRRNSSKRPKSGKPDW